MPKKGYMCLVGPLLFPARVKSVAHILSIQRSPIAYVLFSLRYARARLSPVCRAVSRGRVLWIPKFVFLGPKTTHLWPFDALLGGSTRTAAATARGANSSAYDGPVIRRGCGH